jgi:quinoprotein glucose dehydrogenase
MKDARSTLAALVADAKTDDETRAEALTALDRIRDPERTDLARRLVDSEGPKARVVALRVLVETDPDAAAAPVEKLLEKGRTSERQGVLSILGEAPGSASDRLLLSWLDRLIANQVPQEIQLDLIEAASRRNSSELRAKLEQYEATKPKNDPLAAYREALAGGDARRGMRIFISKAEVSCLRCHKVSGFGGQSFGGDVGPDLSAIGSRQNREYILESIVHPDKTIAQGFESVVLAMSDGKVVTGVLRGEDDKEIRLVTAEGQPLTVSKDDVEERKRGPSAMPADVLTKLSKPELRDLVEFLAGLKEKGK